MDISKASGILNSLAEIVGVAVPVAGPGLAALLKGASQVCIAAEKVNANREAYRQLASDIAGYATAIAEAAQSDSQVSSTGPNIANNPTIRRVEINRLTSVIQDVVRVIDDRQRQDAERRGKFLGKFRQIGYNAWHKDEDEAMIKSLRDRVDEERRSFHITVDVRGLDALQRIESQMKSMIRQQSEGFERVGDRIGDQLAGLGAGLGAQFRQVQYFREYDFVQRKLSPVLTARFDGGDTGKIGCLPGTRVALLGQLYNFVTDKSEAAADIFVLTGLAGTGKTTVAQSLCNDFDSQKLLGASFFVTRISDERRDPEKILQTIVYQLTTGSSMMHGLVAEALGNGRDITTRPLAEQVNTLLTGPLRASNMATHTLIVIDALDECEPINGIEGGELIPLIVAGIREMPGRVRLLITSREEPTIMKMFKKPDINIAQSLIRLQNIEDTVVKADIERYYKHHFDEISREKEYPESTWPSKDHFDLLVEHTGKLFVFAALVVRLLKHKRYSPKDRLEQVLRVLKDGTDGDLFKSLDQLYLDVLTKATEPDPDGPAVDQVLLSRVRDVIGALILLQQPLTPLALSGLLGGTLEYVTQDIQYLSAVLSIPDDMSQPPKIFHPSFADFALTRCTDSRFKIDAPVFHGRLALRCLLLMNDGFLRPKIRGIWEEPQTKADVKSVESKRDHRISLELCYACEYWAVHLRKAANGNAALSEAVKIFCQDHTGHWIEVLSFIGKLPAGRAGLPGAIQWCKSNRIAACTLLEEIECVVQQSDPALGVTGL